MKKSLLVIMLLATLTACSNSDKGVVVDNPYVDCTFETCSKEMLVEQIEASSTTTGGYKGEGKDAEEALIKLYDVTYDEVKKLKNLQNGINSREKSILEEGDVYFSPEKYVKAIIECSGKCESNLVTYDEIIDLTTDEAITLVKEKRKTHLASYSQDNIKELLEEIESFDSLQSNIEKGTCKEIEGAYTFQGLSVSKCSYSSSKDKISITVKNNSGVDLSYIRVEIYGIDTGGNTISSDFTNHSSTIRDRASQTLEAYVDYANSYEVEITEAKTK